MDQTQKGKPLVFIILVLLTILSFMSSILDEVVGGYVSEIIADFLVIPWVITAIIILRIILIIFTIYAGTITFILPHTNQHTLYIGAHGPIIDRVDVLEKFDSLLKPDSYTHVMCLSGQPNMGKTRLVKEFCAKAEKSQTCKVMINMKGNIDGQSSLLDTICNLLGWQHFTTYSRIKVTIDSDQRSKTVLKKASELLAGIEAQKAKDKENSERLLNAFVEDICLLSLQQMVILLFDQLDDAKEPLRSWIAEVLVPKICNKSQQIRVVLSGQHVSEEHAISSDRYVSIPLKQVGVNHFYAYLKYHNIPKAKRRAKEYHTRLEGRPGRLIALISTLQNEEGYR